ncbi:MAG: c-type cytochrome [Candidatus Sulfotelmatobacter sp.]
MGRFVAGLILGLIIVPLCVYAYFATGTAPAATTASPMPFEKKFAHMALEARIDKEAPKSAPFTPDDAAYAAGAQIYKDHCAVCHGLPGQAQTAIAKGEFPKPPKLLEGKGVTDDPAGETYWKVANGIRMTGMPGFDKSLSETQMWQVSFLMAKADKLPAAVKESLAAAPTAVTAPAVPAAAVPAPR